MTKVENILSYKIIGAAIEVHKILGPGLLESVYEEALCHELILQGLSIQRQLPVPIRYKGMESKNPLFIDILADNKIIIEVKGTEKNHSIYHAQLLTYLRLSGMKLGLLINFGTDQIKESIIRIVNGL